MKKPNMITVKTGNSLTFMDRVKHVMRSADKNEPLTPSHTLTFEDPKELLHFLSDAKFACRNRSAVGRDIQELAKFGFVNINEEVNPAGHGHHKIVQLAAARLKLEAYL